MKTAPSQDHEPTEEARILAANLIASAMLRADGTTLDEGSPEGCSELLDAEADGHEPELVNLGGLRVQIVDAEANALALAVGAIDADSPPTLCVRAKIETNGDTPEPEAGQIVVLPTTEDGVWLTFRVWLTYDFVNAPPPAEFGLGPEAVRNPAFDELQRDEVLLVQLLDGEIKEAGQ